MLIITHTGLVVHTDHVAYIALKQHGTEELEAQASGDVMPRFKVLLCFANGESIVAASELTQEAAVFLRQDIAHQWAEGATSLDVRRSLERHQEGAYFALDGTQSAQTQGGE